MAHADNKPQKQIPDHHPSKVIVSRKKGKQSPKYEIDQNIRGYPHYPAKEGVRDQRNRSHNYTSSPASLWLQKGYPR